MVNIRKIDIAKLLPYLVVYNNTQRHEVAATLVLFILGSIPFTVTDLLINNVTQHYNPPSFNFEGIAIKINMWV